MPLGSANMEGSWACTWKCAWKYVHHGLIVGVAGDTWVLRMPMLSLAVTLTVMNKVEGLAGRETARTMHYVQHMHVDLHTCLATLHALINGHSMTRQADGADSCSTQRYARAQPTTHNVNNHDTVHRECNTSNTMQGGLSVTVCSPSWPPASQQGYHAPQLQS